MPKGPRIALCFFGQVKNINKQQVKNLTDNVISPLLELYSAMDIYIHTYNMRTFNNRRNKEYNVSIDVGASISLMISMLRQHHSPQRIFLKGVEISDPHDADLSFRPLSYYLDHGDPWRNKGVSLFYLLRQYYSLDRVTKLWEDKMQSTLLNATYYDAMVYLRPDLIYYDRLPLPTPPKKRSLHGTPLTLFENNAIYAPHFARYNKGLNDRFAMGRPDVMQIYGHRMHDIDRYFATYTNDSLWAEPFLYKVMVEMHGVRYVPLRNFVFTRVRADGTFNET